MLQSISRPPKTKRVLVIGAAISLFAHSSLLALGISMTRPAPATENRLPIDVSFVNRALVFSSPPPRAAGKPVVRTARKKPRPRERRAIVPPKMVPRTTPVEAPSEEQAYEEPQEEARASGAIGGGSAGGIEGSTAIAAGPDVRMEFNETMTPPAMIAGPSPQYTGEALARDVQGLMVVKCVVTKEGAVRECRVIQGLPFMDRAVTQALEGRRYKPALLQGRTVEVDYTFRIRLVLPQ